MVRLDPLDEDMGQTPSQTSDVKERDFPRDDDDKQADDKYGQSETDGPDAAGDIADEGGAHRG